MTKLTLFDNIPQCSGSQITEQMLKYSESTHIYDLGDLTNYMKENVREDIFEEYWQGLQILLRIINEKYIGRQVEIKLVVSGIEE